MLIKDFIEAFSLGKKVGNSAAWKRGAVNVNVLSGFFSAVVVVAQDLGYNVTGIDTDGLAVGVIAFLGLYNAIMHVVTSESIGLSVSGSAGVNDNQSH